MLVAVLLWGGCDGRHDALARVRAQGFIRAGYAHEPPWAFLGLDGIVDGESPDALRGALATVGVDSVRWLRLDFDDLLPALAAGRVDVIASGLFPTPERLGRAGFTRPTSCALAAVAYRKGEPPPAGLEAFLTPGAGRMSVVQGTVEETASTRLGVADSQTLVVPDLATGVEALRAGATRALFLTAPTLSAGLPAETGLAWDLYQPPPAVSELVEGCGALAVRRDDARLLAALDEGLSSYVGSERQARAHARVGAEGIWRRP